ncbi:MAG: hypothetical protein GKR89_14650 [Candidatus Latescibacteria bacterium]|nr:hypothetical protein [Candidatus Latescibacterota bacterium]
MRPSTVLYVLISVFMLYGCEPQKPTQIVTVAAQHENFPLIGAHKQIACISCHVDGHLADMDSTCATCHRADFSASKIPIHDQVGARFDCDLCHTIIAWPDSAFDHNGLDFDLSGAHQALDCLACHTGADVGRTPVFAGLATDCIDCHRDDYNGVDEPNHVDLAYPTDCLACHTDVAWAPVAFDHSQFDFTLNGAHESVACAACHIDGVYEGTPTDCIDCHQDDFTSAVAPPHVEPSFAQNCLECHTEVAWTPSFFDHATTGFQLNGAHVATDCIDCHSNGNYIDTPTDCIDCHQADYDGVEEPDHVAQGFPTDCLDCHTEVAWTPAAFDHSQFDFALNGAHELVACAACHIDGVYEGTPTDCIDCHQDDFTAAVAPPHVEPSFAQNCLECHTEVAWTPSFFDHATTGFQLNGAHVATDCVDCHSNGDYIDTPTDCFSCHAADEPRDHFGPDCAACHTETAWEPSIFNHENFFPISRGNHSRYRNDCTACHIEPPSYNTFSCIDCHDGEHQRGDMDDEHDDVRGYRYESAACLDCHPDGDE